MLKRKDKLLVIVLFLVTVFLTGQARLKLDDLVASFRDDFRDMMYLPRGDGLKVLAFGFDAPLADALFIKGIIYFAETFQAAIDGDAEVVAARRNYTYDLFDVVTDLSPSFARAYEMGALFLTSSASLETNLQGVKLLEKGIDRYSAMEKEGKPAVPDTRWLFHTLIANTYEVSVLVHARTEGDIGMATEARMRAGEEFRLGAASPGAPDFVKHAAAGYAMSLSGQGTPEDSLRAVLSVWEELYHNAEVRGDKDILPELEKRVLDTRQNIDNITATRAMEQILGEAGKKYMEVNGKPAVYLEDLVDAGLIPGMPVAPLDTEDDHDQWLSMPDGTFKSRKLAVLVTENDIDLLQTATIHYIRIHNKPPFVPEDMVREEFLSRIPEPPLKALGQVYSYRNEVGFFENVMPQLVELPSRPDRTLVP